MQHILNKTNTSSMKNQSKTKRSVNDLSKLLIIKPNHGAFNGSCSLPPINRKINNPSYNGKKETRNNPIELSISPHKVPRLGNIGTMITNRVLAAKENRKTSAHNISRNNEPAENMHHHIRNKSNEDSSSQANSECEPPDDNFYYQIFEHLNQYKVTARKESATQLLKKLSTGIPGFDWEISEEDLKNEIKNATKQEIAQIKKDILQARKSEYSYSYKWLSNIYRQVQRKAFQENKAYEKLKNPKSKYQEKVMGSMEKLTLVNQNPFFQINTNITFPNMIQDSEVLASLFASNMKNFHIERGNIKNNK